MTQIATRTTETAKRFDANAITADLQRPYIFEGSNRPTAAGYRSYRTKAPALRSIGERASGVHGRSRTARLVAGEKINRRLMSRLLLQ